MSNVSGYNTATLTLAGTDATSGVASWEITNGATRITGGTGAVPANYSLSSSSLNSGANTLTLTVTDAAGNSATDTVSITKDITAPTATIGSLSTWYNNTFDVPVTLADNNTVAKVAVWTSTTPSDETAPNTPQNAVAGTQTISKNVVYWQNSQSASNYVHVKVIDSVGNVGYDHKIFGFDNIAPTASISFGSSVYDTTTASVTITNNDGNNGSDIRIQIQSALLHQLHNRCSGE